MAHVHASVNKAREKYQRNDKSRTITPPPRAFLGRIKMYNNLLERSHKQLRRKMGPLNGGLEKPQPTSDQLNVFIMQWTVAA